MSSNTKRIRLVILGLGHMGGRALSRALELRRPLEREGIVLELIAIADPDPSACGPIIEYCKHAAPAVTSCKNFDELIVREEIINPSGNLLIYDASPSELHFRNLTAAQSDRLSYFGEKPLILFEKDLARLKRYEFWCDFIETESQAYLTMQHYLKENQLEIKRLKFWREGVTGVKKLLRKERAGVTGGSLEDKVLHDLALSVGLLGPDFIVSPKTRHSADGKFVLFMLNDLEPWGTDGPMFMEATGNPNGTRTLTEVADAAFETSVQWKTDGRFVEGRYRTSWVGISDDLKRFMKNYDLDEKMWLGTGRVEPSANLPGYIVNEARIGYIAAVDARGNDVYMIANFLSSERKEFQGVRPWLKVKIRKGRWKEIPLLKAEYDDSFGGALVRVIKAILEKKEAPLLSNKVACSIHQVMIDARRKAVSRTYNNNNVAHRFLSKLETHFLPFTLTRLKKHT